MFIFQFNMEHHCGQYTLVPGSCNAIYRRRRRVQCGQYAVEYGDVDAAHLARGEYDIGGQFKQFYRYILKDR